MKSSSSFSFVSALNLLVFIIILLHSTFNTYKFGSVNGEPTVVPLPNIDFSEMYPFIQHIDTYISYKTQIESFPNMLLLIYFPWDSITMYEVRQALIEVYKEFSQTDRLFTEYNGELLNGFTLVPITSKSYDNNTSDNKFVVRAINYHNVQDKDLKEKLITLTSPSIRFISSLATERHYFYSQYSSTMLKRFINISLNRKILTDDYRDVCINESTRNEQARQNALNNILEDEQVLIGYFPDQSKDEQLYMEKFYNATFNYVQPLRLKFVKVLSESKLKEYFGCHQTLLGKFKKISTIILYNIVKDVIHVYNSEPKLLTDWVLEKYEPLVGEIQSQSSRKFLEHKNNVILFLESSQNDEIMKAFKKFSLETYKHFRGVEYRFGFVEKEYAKNLYRSYLRSGPNPGQVLTVYNMPEDIFPSTMIVVNNTIYFLDKCLERIYDKPESYQRCFQKFLNQPSLFIHHNSKETKDSVSYNTLKTILTLQFRPKLALVFIFSSSFGSTNYYLSMLDEISQEMSPFLDIFKLDIKYNDIPSELFENVGGTTHAKVDYNLENIPYLILVPNNQDSPTRMYRHHIISYSLLRKWISEYVAQHLVLQRIEVGTGTGELVL